MKIVCTAEKKYEKISPHMLSGKEFNYYIHDKAKKEGTNPCDIDIGKILWEKIMSRLFA